MAKLTDAQATTLTRGSNHDEGLISPAPKTPAPVAHAQAKKLADAGLLERVEVIAGAPWYERDGEGAFYGYRVTAAGFQALGIDEAEWPDYAKPRAEGSQLPEPLRTESNALAAEIAKGLDEAKAGAATGLRGAALAFLAAWDACPYQDATDNPISRSVENLRKALAKTSRPERAAREPRGETKQDQVVTLLKRPSGATNAEIQEATTWAPHTVRGFFAGLKKKGFTILATKDQQTKEMVYRIPA